jgi:hypothetical protein
LLVTEQALATLERERHDADLAALEKTVAIYKRAYANLQTSLRETQDSHPRPTAHVATVSDVRSEISGDISYLLNPGKERLV